MRNIKFWFLILVVTGGSVVNAVAATSKTTVVLQGSTSIFYPVFFRDAEWNNGPFVLDLYRGDVHLDAPGAGSMMVQIRSHSSCWGHGSDFLEYDVHTAGPGPMIAGVARTYYAAGVVVWLRGGRTYYYESSHSTQVQENSANGSELVLYENAEYGVHEAFGTKTAVDQDFEIAGRTVGSNLRIGGSVGIGTANPIAPLDITTDRSYGMRVFRTISNSGMQFGSDNAGGVISSIGVHAIRFYTSDVERLQINASGNVGIGTTSPSEKLSVNGKIRAKEVIVETNWSDYVFAKDYKLAPLSEVEQHIEQQGHLPGVPSAQEVAEKGVSVGDMQAILLAKIEELTLHQIAQEKELAAQRNQIAASAAKIDAQQAEIARLKTK